MKKAAVGHHRYDTLRDSAWRGALCLALMLTSFNAHAKWFVTGEQAAAQAFEQGDYTAAAEGFSDDYRRGVALYRAGRYGEAASAFERVERPEVEVDALYNLGNSRFMEGEYERAIEAYESTLSRRPDHEDAQHNLALAEKMLLGPEVQEPEAEPEQTPEESQDADKQKEQDEQQTSEQQESENQSGEQQQESESQSGEQQQESESQSGEQQQESQSQSGEQQQDSESQGGEQSGEQQGDTADSQSGEQAGEEEGQGADSQTAQAGQQQGDRDSQTGEQTGEQEGQGSEQQAQAEGQNAGEPDNQAGEQRAEQKDGGDESELQAEQGQQHESDVGASGEEADEDMGDGEQQAEGQFGGEEMTQQQAAGDDESLRDEAGKGTELSEAPTEAPGDKDAEEPKDGSDQGNEMTADKESTGEQPTEDKSAESDAGQPDDQRQKNTQQADDKYAKVEESEGGTPPEDDTPDGRGDTATESPVDEGTSSQAVERFDQLGGGMNPTDEQTTQEGGLPDKEGTATASLGGVLMDQWLERIEGDPAFLLRNQFMLEEKRALEQTGRELIETRPW